MHNHAPGIVECSNGDLLVSWYRGSGERKADDVAVYGARLASGSRVWSKPFLMADTPGFPDCNTCMIVDNDKRLWLFWPTILANSWESCITNFRVSDNYQDSVEPKWLRQGVILLKPDAFEESGNAAIDKLVEEYKEHLSAENLTEIAAIREQLGDKLLQRLGWQPRCKPTILPSGRILLPLYTDTFSVSMLAISDDNGETWFASKPLFGFGNIQPTVLRRSNGSLVAYMRDNGPANRILVSESQDEGLIWTLAKPSDLPNPGSGLDGIRLANGHWALVYNDSKTGRESLFIAISDDEGATWQWGRHLEKRDSGSFHYPAITQGDDETIHVVYSYFVAEGKTMKHAAFDESWVRAK